MSQQNLQSTNLKRPTFKSFSHTEGTTTAQQKKNSAIQNEFSDQKLMLKNLIKCSNKYIRKNNPLEDKLITEINDLIHDNEMKLIMSFLTGVYDEKMKLEQCRPIIDALTQIAEEHSHAPAMVEPVNILLDALHNLIEYEKLIRETKDKKAKHTLKRERMTFLKGLTFIELPLPQYT
jgi:hypothetical protein